MKIIKYIPFIILIIGLNGCMAAFHTRIKGGSTEYTSGSGATIKQVQSDDPKNASTINNNSEKTIEYTLPVGSKIYLEDKNPVISKTITNQAFAILSSNTPVVIHIKDTLKSTTGAAQENTLANTIAKLSSLKPVMYVGIVLLLFGIGSAFYPPLKLIVGSITTSAVCAITGVALIALPSVIVGHEMEILCIGIGLVCVWWFSHHHGAISREAKILREFIDKNNDQKDDTTGLTKEEFDKTNETSKK